jgi:hypothetical protein
MQEMGTTLDPESIASEITEMVNEKIIDKDLGDRLKAVHNSSFKRLASKEVNISTFTKAKDNQDLEANGRGDLEAKGKGKGKSKCSKSKHCRFVEVTQNEKTVYISKTIAVWLLQEGERVSTDRLWWGIVRKFCPGGFPGVKSKTRIKEPCFDRVSSS